MPVLALGGGLAYASTASGNTSPVAHTAVTTTVQPSTHHPDGQASHNRDGHRYDYRCDWRGHSYQQPAAPRQATPGSGYRHDYRHHRGSHMGYQGTWG